MKWNVFLIASLLMFSGANCWAQDSKPQRIQKEQPLPEQQRHMSKLHGLSMGDTEFQFTPTSFPRTFTHIRANHLLNGEPVYGDDVPFAGARAVCGADRRLSLCRFCFFD